jgi:hypothetical protein
MKKVNNINKIDVSTSPFQRGVSWLDPIKRRLKYMKHEFKCWKDGDTRDDFEKLVDKCRILRLKREIHNMG